MKMQFDISTCSSSSSSSSSTTNADCITNESTFPQFGMFPSRKETKCMLRTDKALLQVPRDDNYLLRYSEYLTKMTKTTFHVSLSGDSIVLSSMSDLPMLPQLLDTPSTGSSISSPIQHSQDVSAFTMMKSSIMAKEEWFHRKKRERNLNKKNPYQIKTKSAEQILQLSKSHLLQRYTSSVGVRSDTPNDKVYSSWLERKKEKWREQKFLRDVSLFSINFELLHYLSLLSK